MKRQVKSIAAFQVSALGMCVLASCHKTSSNKPVKDGDTKSGPIIGRTLAESVPGEGAI